MSTHTGHLTRIALAPRDGIRYRSDTHMTHRTALWLADQPDGTTPRVLWALRGDNLWVRSAHPIDPDRAGRLGETTHTGPHEPITTGAATFTALLNPTRMRRTIEGGKTTSRWKETVDPHEWVEGRLGWLTPGTLVVSDRFTRTVRRPDGRMFSYGVYDVTLTGTVTDPGRAYAAQRDGIGDARGFGCGLLIGAKA